MSHRCWEASSEGSTEKESVNGREELKNDKKKFSVVKETPKKHR